MPEAPIFVVPLARSGGTLLATLLDAHSRVSMSYEIYPDLLVDTDGAALRPDTVRRALDGAQRDDPVSWVRAAGQGRPFETFCFRARRGGVEIGEIIECLEAHVARGGTFDTLHERLDFIDDLSRTKARKEGAARWGGKMKCAWQVLIERDEQATFLCSIRDGRDILASRQQTGSFDLDPRQIAREWVDHIDAFDQLVDAHPTRALRVHYEGLVESPERWARSICDLVGEPYEPAMLAFEEQSLSLFRAPHGHLSSEQLQAGLNAKSVGRWREELSSEDRQAFESVAAETLERCGYSL